MGLQEQHVAFKFAGGIETKMDPKAVPAVRLLDLQNGVFTRAISIKKRNGYSRRSRSIDGSTSLIENARRLAARDDELLLFTYGNCYAQQRDADQWVDAGALVAPLGSDRAVVHTGTAQTAPDQAVNHGVRVVAWQDSLGGVWWTAVDKDNGRIYRAPEQANASASRPRCVPAGDAVIVLYAVGTQIRGLVVNTSTPTADVAEVTIVEDLDATHGYFDVKPTTRTETPALLAWRESSTTNVHVSYLTAAGTLGSPGSGHPSGVEYAAGCDATSPVACAYTYVDGSDADRIAISFIQPDGTGHIVALSAGAGVTSIGSTSAVDTTAVTGTAAVRIAATFTGLTAWAVFEETAVETSEHWCHLNSVTDGVADTARTIRSLCLAANAFTVNDDAFAVFVHDTIYFNTYLTLRLSDFAPAGRHLEGSACSTVAGHLPSAYVADNVATFVVPYKTRLKSENNDKFTESAVRLATLDFDSEDTHQTAQFGRGLYLAAACPQHYAGRIWTEQGFHVGPEHMVPTPASGGSLVDSGTYEYVFWYEWTDDLGEIHRGPTSPGFQVDLGGGETQLTWQIPTLRVTRKSNVRICVGRSRDGDASELFRVSSLDPTTSGAAANGYIANDPTVDHVIWIDRMSDADCALQEPLYTTGGILSNDPAPLGSHIAVGKNRLFFTDAESDSVVRFSKRIATGFGAECAPELQLDIDPFGGRITALAVMDDVVFVFKASAIMAFNGDGPFEDGSNTSSGVVSGFSSSQIITSDVGCTDPGSIVLTPAGLMFKSAKGIRLITRSREVVPIGDPVEAYNAQSVRRATVMPDRTAVIFLTDDGTSLYFDYNFGQWSRFTNHEGLDAVVVDNTYHYLRADSSVFRETIDVHQDDGARIPLRFETAWLHLLEHLQGFQRFWKLLLLGTWTSPHQLLVQHRLNYDEAWTAPYYLDATGENDSAGWITGDDANPIGEDPIVGSNYGDGDYGYGPYGGTGPDVYQWRYGIHEDGQSIQFRFEDFERDGLAGASFELTEMTIVGGVKKVDMRPFSGARST